MRQKHLNSDEEKLISDYLTQNKIIDDSIQLIEHIPLMFKLADSMKKTEKDVQLFLKTHSKIIENLKSYFNRLVKKYELSDMLDSLKKTEYIRSKGLGSSIKEQIKAIGMKIQTGGTLIMTHYKGGNPILDWIVIVILLGGLLFQAIDILSPTHQPREVESPQHRTSRRNRSPYGRMLTPPSQQGRTAISRRNRMGRRHLSGLAGVEETSPLHLREMPSQEERVGVSHVYPWGEESPLRQQRPEIVLPPPVQNMSALGHIFAPVFALLAEYIQQVSTSIERSVAPEAQLVSEPVAVESGEFYEAEPLLPIAHVLGQNTMTQFYERLQQLRERVPRLREQSRNLATESARLNGEMQQLTRNYPGFLLRRLSSYEELLSQMSVHNANIERFNRSDPGSYIREMESLESLFAQQQDAPLMSIVDNVEAPPLVVDTTAVVLDNHNVSPYRMDLLLFIGFYKLYKAISQFVENLSRRRRGGKRMANRVTKKNRHHRR